MSNPEPINIWSGGSNLGAALSLNTTKAKEKGTVSKDYPLLFNGQNFPDALAAFESFSVADDDKDIELLTDILTLKFITYPQLLAAINQQFGQDNCLYLTNAMTWLMLCYIGRVEDNFWRSHFILSLCRAYFFSTAQLSLAGAGFS